MKKKKREPAYYRFTYRNFTIDIEDHGPHNSLGYIMTGSTHPKKRKGLFAYSLGLDRLIKACEQYIDKRLIVERKLMLQAIGEIEDERREK